MSVYVCVLLLFLPSSRILEAELLFLGVDAFADPIHALLNPLTSEGGAGLNLPHAIPDGVQIETLGDLRGRGSCQQVLLVCKDQHRNTT